MRSDSPYAPARHRRRQTTPWGERAAAMQRSVSEDDYALLLTLGHGETGADIQGVIRTVEALPPDALQAIVGEARAADADRAEDNAAGDSEMVR